MTARCRGACVLAGFAAIVSASCAGSMGMDRGSNVQLADGQAPVVDNAAIERELGRRPQLPERPRIGVWFRPPPTDGGERLWRWTHDEREQIVKAGEELEDVELFPLSDSIVEGTSLEALRFAAARHGADALVVVEGGYEQRSDTNGWAASYALVLPLLFAPAGELETVFSLDAAMFDVRNGYLYLTAESEADDTQERAHVWIDSEAGVEATKGVAVEHLASELKRRLEHMLADPRSAAPTRADEEQTPAEPEPASPEAVMSPPAEIDG